LFAAADDTLTLTATDGYRLARQVLRLPAHVSPWRAIVPVASCRKVARLCKAADFEAEIHLGLNERANNLMLRIVGDTGVARNITIFSTLINAKFPDYSAIIPKDYATRTTVDTTDLQKALRAVGLFAVDANNRVELKLQADTLSVRGVSAETGDAQSEIAATVEGAGLIIYVDVRYLCEALAALNTSPVVIETVQFNQPIVLKSGGNTNLLHVIMPMEN
jgi:DNA polymerase-3 subunit beta